MTRFPRPAPLLLIDTREQRPLDFPGHATARICLPAGDYGLRGHSGEAMPDGSLARRGFAVERKSVADLVGSLTSGRRRFMAELERLRTFEFAAILIEGLERDVADYITDRKRRVSLASVLGSLEAIEVRQGVHICWRSTRDGAAAKIAAWAKHYSAGFARDCRNLCEPPAVGPVEEIEEQQDEQQDAGPSQQEQSA